MKEFGKELTSEVIHLDTNQKKVDFRIAPGKGKMMPSSLIGGFVCVVFSVCGVTSYVDVQEQELRTQKKTHSMCPLNTPRLLIFYSDRDKNEKVFFGQKTGTVCVLFSKYSNCIQEAGERGAGWFLQKQETSQFQIVGVFFVPVHVYLQHLVLHDGSRAMQCLITVWKGFFPL